MKKQLGAGTITFPTPVYIVGTYNEDGSANVMNVAWGGMCASEPPCVEIALNTGRRTRENILRTGAFTIHIATKELMEQSDYFGLVSGSKADKLAEVGFTTTKSETVDAPVIDAYPMVLECEMRESHEIGPHLMVVGEIKGVLAEEEVLNEKGSAVDITKIAPICYDPSSNQYILADTVAGAAFGAGIKYLKK